MTLPAFAPERRAAVPLLLGAGSRRCRSISPAHTALSSKLAARRSMGQTDRPASDARPFHRPFSAYYAGSANNTSCEIVEKRQLSKSVRRILVRGSMPRCRLRRLKFLKFDYEMVHSEVYLNKYVVSIAPFTSPPIQKTALLHVFAF